VDLRYPLATKVWDQPEPARTTAAEEMKQLQQEVAAVLNRARATKVVLVAQSRGGNVVRTYIKNGGGAAHTAMAILCGAVNHGVIVSDKILVGRGFHSGSRGN